MRLRAVSCGCVRLRAVACGYVRLRAVACGCVRSPHTRNEIFVSWRLTHQRGGDELGVRDDAVLAHVHLRTEAWGSGTEARSRMERMFVQAKSGEGRGEGVREGGRALTASKTLSLLSAAAPRPMACLNSFSEITPVCTGREGGRATRMMG